MRPLLPALFASAFTALLFAGCNPDLTEGCLGGTCPPPETATTTTAGNGTCGPLPAKGDFPCDVFQVIHGSCNPCHVDPPLAGAPFPLLTYEETQKPYDSHGKLIYQRMREVIQPDGAPHMPFKSPVIVVPPLTDAQFATLDAWLACPTVIPDGQGCECPGQGCTALPP